MAHQLADLLSMGKVYRDAAMARLKEFDPLHPGRYFRDVRADAEATLTRSAVSELQDLVTPGFERDEFLPAEDGARAPTL